MDQDEDRKQDPLQFQKASLEKNKAWTLKWTGLSSEALWCNYSRSCTQLQKHFCYDDFVNFDLVEVVVVSCF